MSYTSFTTFDIPDPCICTNNMCTLQCEGVFTLPEILPAEGNDLNHLDATIHYQLCWELGNTYPFGADKRKIKVLALNTIRALRNQVSELQFTINGVNHE